MDCTNLGMKIIEKSHEGVQNGNEIKLYLVMFIIQNW